MILRRLTSGLKEQHWTTIFIELLIVIIGVFVGTQVSNWNQARVERLQTQRLLDQLVPALSYQLAFFDDARAYYARTHHYAEQALAAWKGDPAITDEQFVIAAYQASQIYGIGINAQNWALTFGEQQLRDIDDVKLRQHLALVLTSDYEPVSEKAVTTPYRENVRQIIPNAIQDAIRARCGDRANPDFSNIDMLPATCQLKLDPAGAREAAADLRAHPDLAQQLNFHLSSVATYLQNAGGLENQMRTLKTDIERRR
jgi:hypothetical protein